MCASAMIWEAILSFLNGNSADIPTWGNIIAEEEFIFKEHHG